MASSTSPLKRENTRLRDRFSTSLRLSRFLGNSPAPPARYSGIDISPPKEQWYLPPSPPKPQRPLKKTNGQKIPTRKPVRAQRDSLPEVVSPSIRVEDGSEQLSLPEQRQTMIRAHSTPDHNVWRHSMYAEQLASFETYQTPVMSNVFTIYDTTRNPVDNVVRSGLLFDLIQTIPAVWLTMPKIRESFIPLLRTDHASIEMKAPAPTELRLVDGFLEQLPDIHIVRSSWSTRRDSLVGFKRNLSLSAEAILFDCRSLTSRSFPNSSNRIRKRI